MGTLRALLGYSKGTLRVLQRVLQGAAGYASALTAADFAGERCADEVGAGGDVELVQKAAAAGKECPCEYPE